MLTLISVSGFVNIYPLWLWFQQQFPNKSHRQNKKLKVVKSPARTIPQVNSETVTVGASSQGSVAQTVLCKGNYLTNSSLYLLFADMTHWQTIAQCFYWCFTLQHKLFSLFLIEPKAQTNVNPEQSLMRVRAKQTGPSWFSMLTLVTFRRCRSEEGRERGRRNVSSARPSLPYICWQCCAWFSSQLRADIKKSSQVSSVLGA